LNIKDKANKGSVKRIASWLLIIIVVSPFLVYAVPQVIGAEDALIVKSGSM
jgi:hypothetical protein